MTLSQQAILEKYNPWFMMCFDRPPIPGAAEFARRIHELAPRAGDRYIEKLVNDALEWSKPIRDRELLENRAILIILWMILENPSKFGIQGVQMNLL
jgi:hypothetical protein